MYATNKLLIGFFCPYPAERFCIFHIKSVQEIHCLTVSANSIYLCVCVFRCSLVGMSGCWWWEPPTDLRSWTKLFLGTVGQCGWGRGCPFFFLVCHGCFQQDTGYCNGKHANCSCSTALPVFVCLLNTTQVYFSVKVSLPQHCQRATLPHVTFGL